jgi:hypothetical protein
MALDEAMQVTVASDEGRGTLGTAAGGSTEAAAEAVSR